MLGVQEIPLNELSVKDLRSGELITTSDRIRHDRETAAHLYEVSNAIGTSPTMKVVTLYSDDDLKPEIHEASTTLPSVFRDYDNRFEKGLVPVVRYSIHTPVLTIEFPDIDHLRYVDHWRASTTRGTAVIHSPFRVNYHQQTDNILRLMRINKSDSVGHYLANLAVFNEQATRVIKAVESYGNFHTFTKHCIELSAELDKKHLEEHLASIR